MVLCKTLQMTLKLQFKPKSSFPNLLLPLNVHRMLIKHNNYIEFYRQGFREVTYLEYIFIKSTK